MMFLNVNSGYAETLAVPCAARTEQQGFWGTAPGAVPQNLLTRTDVFLGFLGFQMQRRDRQQGPPYHKGKPPQRCNGT